MKKNKMMRIAAVLLVVTLLSTCAISGTFAKYVTKADVSDSARVAKWGIKIDTTSTLFSDTYVAEDEDYLAAGGTLSVDAADDAKVVAPGTTSYTYDDNGDITGAGFSATVSGKPEVATRFALEINLEDLKDVFMPFANGYTDYSVTPASTFDLGVDNAAVKAYIDGYSPVKWDVKVTRVTENGDGRYLSLADIASEVASTQYGAVYDAFFTDDGISITDAQKFITKLFNSSAKDTYIDLIKAKIDADYPEIGARNLDIDVTRDKIVLSMDFDPNSNVNYRFDAGWTWAYEQTAPSFITDTDAQDAYVEMLNKADTYLGNAAAGIVSKTALNGKTVSTDIKFAITASATQID